MKPTRGASVDAYAVQTMRRRKRLTYEKFKFAVTPHRSWTKTEKQLLAKFSDAEVAKKLDRTVKGVTAIRKRFNIRKHPK